MNKETCEKHEPRNNGINMEFLFQFTNAKKYEESSVFKRAHLGRVESGIATKKSICQNAKLCLWGVKFDRLYNEYFFGGRGVWLS